MRSLSLRVAAGAAVFVSAVVVVGCGARVRGGTNGEGGSGGGQGGSGVGTACDQDVGTPCDCDAFPECPIVPVQGIPCCQIRKFCEELPYGDGACAVNWTGAICYEPCDLSCVNAQDPDQCAAIGCKPTSAGCVTP